MFNGIPSYDVKEETMLKKQWELLVHNFRKKQEAQQKQAIADGHSNQHLVGQN